MKVLILTVSLLAVAFADSTADGNDGVIQQVIDFFGSAKEPIVPDHRSEDNVNTTYLTRLGVQEGLL